MNELQKSELLEIQNERKKFTIFQREKVASDESKKKTISSIMAATCILNASIEIYFGDLNANEAIKHELNSIYSWETLKQYFQNLDQICTLLGISAGTFVTKSFKYSKKYREIMHQFENMNSLLQKKVNNMEVE